MSERAIKAAHAHLTARYGGDKRLAFVADPHVQTTAGGRSIVHLQQHYDGIPLFGCDIAVHLDDGEVSQVKGSSVEAAPSGDGTPDIGAIDAVAAAIAHFRAKSDRSACQAPHRSLRGAIPPLSTVASFPFPARPTVFRLGRAEPSPAAYLAYRPDGGALRLVWVVRAPFRAQSYLLLVSAEGEDCGRVTLCTRWSAGAKCFGTVFSFNHAAGPTRMPFPMPLAQFPPLLPHANSAFLGDWIATDRSEGNNAHTFDGNSETLLQAVMAGGSLEFPVVPSNSKEQTLLNAFFYCNFLHDFFLMLGFGEAEGNFQKKNFSSTKGGNDRLQVRIFDTKDKALGDMEAMDDGVPAELSLSRAPSGEPTGLGAGHS